MKVTSHYVKADDGHPWNELADPIANKYNYRRAKYSNICGRHYRQATCQRDDEWQVHADTQYSDKKARRTRRRWKQAGGNLSTNNKGPTRRVQNHNGQ
eukprot:5549519-Pyramimonas_sp.AAC.1